jgi:hypothetical protein
MNITLLFILVANGKMTFDKITKIITNRVNLKKELGQNLVYIFVYVIDIGASIVIGLFFKFHLVLVLENKTTIETIDKKGTYFESIVLIFLPFSTLEALIIIGLR